MKVLTFGGEKGGIGKSTQAYNFSCWLSIEKKEKVLLIDNDWRCNLSSTFELTNKNNTVENMYFGGEVTIHSIYPMLDFIPATVALRDVGTELERQKKRDYESLLLFWLQDNVDRIEKYDWIIFDTHGDMEILTKNALVASHFEITPLEPSDWGYQARFSTAHELEKLKSELFDRRTNTSLVTTQLFFIGNKIDTRTSASQQFLKQVEKDSMVVANFPLRQIFSTSTLERIPVVKLLKQERFQSSSYQKFQELLYLEYQKMYQYIQKNL